VISYRKIISIALPIILGGLASSFVNVTDTAFLGHYGGEVPLAAAGNGTVIYLLLLMAGIGFCMGGEIMIARRVGEGNNKAIGKIFFHILSPLIIFSLIFIVLTLSSINNMINTICKSESIALATNTYLSYRVFGLFFSFISQAFKAFYVGVIQTKIIAWNVLLVSAINVVLNYVLIFGNWGFPEMGIRGAAIASVISEAIGLLHYVYYTTRFDHKKYDLFKIYSLDWSLMKTVSFLSAPIILKNVVSITSWLIFFLIIEQMSQRDLAISHISRSIYMVFIIPLLGFSEATSTLVSNLIGRGEYDGVIGVIKKICLLSFISTVLIIPLIIFCPEFLASFYTNDVSLIKDIVPTLRVVAGIITIFPISYILFCGVIGTGNTKVVLMIEIVSVIVYIYLTYKFALDYKLAIHWVWCSEYIYFVLMGIIASLYLASNKWKNKIL